MKYAIDRLEDDIVVLENIETKEKKMVAKDLLPDNIRDGVIIKIIEDKYIIDSDCYDDRRQKIKEKMERLKRLKDEKNNE